MINWSIISLESFKDTGIVVSAHWKCSTEQVSKTGHSVFNLDFLHLTQPSILAPVKEDVPVTAKFPPTVKLSLSAPDC